MNKVYLTKNLRRSVLRGHPWLYQDAIEFKKKISSGEMVEILDQKRKPLGWGIFDADNPIVVRVLSCTKRPPKSDELYHRVLSAIHLRRNFIDPSTNCFRLINGEGDRLPGLVCDIYDKTAVIQTDGPAMSAFWFKYPILDWLNKNIELENIIDKSRALDAPKLLMGHLQESTEVSENQRKFAVNCVSGQKTGFFIDQRDNRLHLSKFCENRRVLNLYSYTGGFSIFAGSGLAAHVTSVDIAANAVADAQKNWELNGFAPNQHEGITSDCFEFLQHCDEMWDCIVVDPPSMAPSEKAKPAAIKKYTEIFALACERLRPEGHLFLSSCSSHISFNDFFDITANSLSNARKTGQMIQVSGQAACHPFPHSCPEMRYLKFVHVIL